MIQYVYAIQNGVSYFSCGIFTRATSKVTISQVKTSKVTISQVKTSKVTISQVKPSKVTISQVETSKVTISQVKTLKVTISQVKTSKVTISQVKTSKVTISQVKTSQIYNFPSGDFPKSTTEAPQASIWVQHRSQDERRSERCGLYRPGIGQRLEGLLGKQSFGKYLTSLEHIYGHFHFKKCMIKLFFLLLPPPHPRMAYILIVE